MLTKPDFSRLANTIVKQCMKIREGETVLVEGGLHTAEFIEEMAVALRSAGAFTVIDVDWDSVARRLMTYRASRSAIRQLSFVFS